MQWKVVTVILCSLYLEIHLKLYSFWYLVYTEECPSFSVHYCNCWGMWAVNDFTVLSTDLILKPCRFEIRCMWDWGKVVLLIFCTFSDMDLFMDLRFKPAALLLWSFCIIHIFLDICVGARIFDSELLKCFCIMLASFYVMGTPDSATCSVFLPREAVVTGLLPRDEITPLFINEFSIL